ncbi:MAG: hypothetical protein LPD71_07000 [Shewanella sp.]|nr:hypothetical protein [Shewanella sp.]
MNKMALFVGTISFFSFATLVADETYHDPAPSGNEQAHATVSYENDSMVIGPGRDFDNGTDGRSTDHDFSDFDPGMVDGDDMSIDHNR